jgi:hypothetical protein
MCLFWKHLPQATWTNDGKVLQLAEGTHFLGREEYSDKLMLRDCYSDFESMIDDHFAGTGKGFAVIGNPGKEQASMDCSSALLLPQRVDGLWLTVLSSL